MLQFHFFDNYLSLSPSNLPEKNLNSLMLSNISELIPVPSHVEPSGSIPLHLFSEDTLSLSRYCDLKYKKLRDVLQEREGTSLNFFKVFF